MSFSLGSRFSGVGRFEPRHILNPQRCFRWLSNAATTAWATATNWDWGIFAPANDTLSDVAVFDATSYTSQPNAGTTSALGIYIAPTSAAFTLSGTALTLGGGNVMSSGANAVTIACPLTGACSIIHDGSGTLTLSGTNTHTAGTVIRAGTVTATVAGALGGASGNGTVTVGDTMGNANATLVLGGSTLTYANPITIATGSSGTKTIAGPGAGNVSATITGGIATGPGFTYDIRGATIVYSTTAMTGSGPISVLNSTVGTQASEFVNLSQASTGYTGALTVTSTGNVRVSASNGLSQASSISVASGGIFQASAVTINMLGFNDSAGGGGTVSAVSGSRTFSLNGTGSYSFSGVISNGGGTISLTKSGAGTQVLGGACTYTGATTLSSITSGTLQINGSLGATAISWGASGNTILAAPASGSGNATLGGTMTGIATSRWSFPSTATTFSKFTVTGNVTFSGGFVDFPAGITTNGTYDLIVCNATMSGTLPAVGTNSTAGKTLSLSQVGNTLKVTVS